MQMNRIVLALTAIFLFNGFTVATASAEKPAVNFNLPPPPPPPGAAAAPAPAGAPATAAGTTPRRTGGGAAAPKAPTCVFGTVTEDDKERCKTVEEHDEELTTRVVDAIAETKAEEVKTGVAFWAIIIFLTSLAINVSLFLFFRKKSKGANEAADKAVKAAEDAQTRVEAIETALAQAGQNNNQAGQQAA